MEICTFGVGGRIKRCEAQLAARHDSSCYKRLILLPIPTTRDKKYITGTDVPLSELLPIAESGVLVAGYNLPDSLGEALVLRGADIYDAALDESFLCENADITAKGALGKIMTCFEKDVSELSVGILGYGRIGKALLRYLLFLGASPTVYTGTPATEFSLCEAGIDCRLVSDGVDLSGLDLLINTAPARQIPDAEVERLPPGTLVLDLASGNYLPPTPSVMKLQSVPDAMYPITAGDIYARYIAKRLFTPSGQTSP